MPRASPEQAESKPRASLGQAQGKLRASHPDHAKARIELDRINARVSAWRTPLPALDKPRYRVICRVSTDKLAYVVGTAPSEYISTGRTNSSVFGGGYKNLR